jgi:hypothetical protein
MAESEAQWWGLAEVAPASEAAGFPEGMVGAFVGVAGRAGSSAEFASRVRESCGEQSLLLIDLADVCPLAESDDVEDELVAALDDSPEAIAFGVFHMYPGDELN